MGGVRALIYYPCCLCSFFITFQNYNNKSVVYLDKAGETSGSANINTLMSLPESFGDTKPLLLLLKIHAQAAN
jgi:hypothetical protein